METNIFFILTTLLFLQRFGLSHNMLMPSLNVTCSKRERQSLLAIKHSLTDTFNLLSTWSGVECCDWHGVGCDHRNGHVVKLDLRSQVSLETYPDGKLLKGNIPEFLGSFQRLKYLNLSHSFPAGVVPHHLGNLSRLEYLDLSYPFVKDPYRVSGFEGLPVLDDMGWVSSLWSLRYLDLSGISIGKHIDWFHPISMLPSLLTLNLVSSGIKNIPSVKFINFTSLNSLDLSFNYINSTIPVWLSNLTGLMHLYLNHNHFHGEIPYLLCNLSSLVHLDISQNMVSGPIPQSIGRLLRLEDLNLQGNQLSGNIPMSGNQLSGNIPMSVGQLSKLKNLDLSYNSFETLMPDLLCNLSSLVHLVLAENRFSGQIPACFGQLLMLEDRSLEGNELSGNIPMSLGQLSKLKNLDLSYNSLVGVLSETYFSKLQNLNYLALSGNPLVLNFSSLWIPPFQLQTFDASFCNNGPHFPNWLQTQTHLQRLYLSNSSIIDTIPEWFENIMSHILVLDLSNNQISGKLPRFHFNKSDNRWDDGILNLKSNKFEGLLATFPSNVRILDLSDNLLSGHLPQTDGTMNLILEVVKLSKNRFTGSIPVHLCKVPSIYVLDLSQNKFSGRLPGCLGNLIGLGAMDVSNNTLTGVVPSSLGSLTQLVSLHFHNNKFEGNLPLSLQNLTRLITLDTGNNFLTGSIPSWIGESLLNLRILNLQSNKFTGKIPLQLCQLSALQYLNLAQNHIIGTVPHCFSNFSGMITYQEISVNPIYYYEENILAVVKGIQWDYTKTLQFLTVLDLSSNNITGEIPDVLMNLVGLYSLNLARNHLKGQIPTMIGHLRQIESLDLSMNMLSGQIPQSLTSLNSLSYLNLSFNNLSGAIPVGNQLQTLVDPYIYEGNSGLCGPPVSSSCKGNNSSYNDVGEDKGQDDDEGLWFYFGMGPGFVVGFVGLFGSLHFIRRWRVAYFQMLENVYGWLAVSILVNLARLRRTFF
ncbi:putative leucine-rich repeat-containing, plant-type, leucine-rich repeat domain superfamily [Helianthus annuus]|nr:putative leucine-rich repeat-containing, plant-type, leucine-rich repeat domain superfamily [Helianthus annuus]